MRIDHAAHLVGLCCGLEVGGAPRFYWAVARWLDGPRDPTRPAVPAARGAATVADVAGVSDDAAYAASVRQWARAVWAAYGAQHEVVRGWLRAAVGAARRGVAPSGRR